MVEGVTEFLTQMKTVRALASSDSGSAKYRRERKSGTSPLAPVVAVGPFLPPTWRCSRSRASETPSWRCLEEARRSGKDQNGFRRTVRPGLGTMQVKMARVAAAPSGNEKTPWKWGKKLTCRLRSRRTGGRTSGQNTDCRSGR